MLTILKDWHRSVAFLLLCVQRFSSDQKSNKMG